MPEPTRLLRRLLGVAACLVVVACGSGGTDIPFPTGAGGGGGSGGQPGSGTLCNPDPRVLFVSPPDDPLFAQQWHLANDGTLGGTVGADARVVAAWTNENVTGAGHRIVIIDDGVQIVHEDLMCNVVGNDASLDLVDRDSDPTPNPVGFGAGSQDAPAHGTACAGVAAGIGHNGVGITGAAPRALLVGVRFNGFDAGFAEATALQLANNEIFNLSFGPTEDGTVQVAGATSWAAISNGIATGRGGKGALYPRASGNGGDGNRVPGSPPQYSNTDELNNHPGILCIAATNADDVRTIYSQRGSCLLVAAPSNDNLLPGITTADLLDANGFEQPAGNYTNAFGGTSSSAPLVAGILALVLEANPDLTWRDVRQVLARSARMNDVAGGGWFANGAGRMVSHWYGYGVVDANAAVALARTWVLLPAVTVHDSTTLNVGLAVPAPGTPLTAMHTLTNVALTQTEHAVVTLDIDSTRFRDLLVTLTSPGGTVSILSEEANSAMFPLATNFSGSVRLGTTLCLDEDPNGAWTLSVSDANGGGTHTLNAWRLQVWAH